MCVFCTIVDQDPHQQIEQRFCSSILITPFNPVVEGHKLVIPKWHIESAVTFPVLFGLVMEDAALYAAEVGDCNIITSVGRHATQTVFHLHVHVVPRREDDGLALPWTGQLDGR